MNNYKKNIKDVPKTYIQKETNLQLRKANWINLRNIKTGDKE